MTASSKFYRAVGGFLLIGLNFFVPVHAATVSANQNCEARANGTAAQLVACIRQLALWNHLAVFQRIANQNPGPNGHANRDTGTSGYKASIDYVAGLMLHAGYRVTIQPYIYTHLKTIGVPEFAVAGQSYALGRDWFVARLSGSGAVTAPVQPVGGEDTGCTRREFAGFVAGNIALLRRGACDFDIQVANAERAGAAAVILYNSATGPAAEGKGARGDGGGFEARLATAANIPVAGVASSALGAELYRQYIAGNPPVAQLDVRTEHKSDIDYNLIANSPFGDPNRVVVIDAHLDSIYGAGMLDNASGSTTILEIALQMAKTPTRNQLRYIWFGGEELGLLGSHYYTRHLTARELSRIAFDMDVDVTATPNFDILVADPKFAHDADRFPPNVVPESRVGNRDFANYFKAAGLVSRPAGFGNDGTDSNSFSLVGVPNSGILTQQDCCKKPWERKLWGGFLGNYEGKIPSFNGGCVDQPHRWCDNLSNNDPFVLEFVSKAVAYVTFELANDASLRH